MAIKLDQSYPGRSTPGDASYPDGSFKNESTEGAEDGTPLKIAWANNHEGFFQSLLNKAGVTADGTPDTVLKSQYMAALMLLTPDQTRPPAASIGELCSGLPEVSWHAPSASPNYKDTGHTIKSSCLCWDAETDRPIILYIASTTSFYAITGLWDYENDPVVSTAWAGFNFPSLPSEAMSICSDGDYIYVAWRRASDGTIMVSKYASNPFTGARLWTANTGVINAGDPEDTNYFELIVADSSRLALSMPDLVLGDTRHGVAIIAKSSGGVTLGHGNNTVYTTAAGSKPRRGHIVSDGSHIWWLGCKGVFPDDIYLVSAKISDPTTSDYSILEVATDVADTAKWLLWHGLTNIGGSDGAIIYHNRQGLIESFNKAEDAKGLSLELSAINYAAYTGGGSVDYDMPVGFDGLNLWIPHLIPESAGDSGAVFFHKVSAAHFTSAARFDITTWPIYPEVVSINYDTQETAYKSGKMIFDGRDMWVVFRSGEVYRLTASANR